MTGHGSNHSYFTATAIRGRFMVQGISARKHWDSKHLVYWDDSIVDTAMNVSAGDRKVYTVQELQEIIDTSESGDNVIQIWIHEALEDVVRYLWERQAISSANS